ncbi:MAG: alpha/beta fold hydrolase [Gemmataceae bacterium]|nr:alpha/beta fold hydrolase [Gemmataceae bacterium]
MSALNFALSIVLLAPLGSQKEGRPVPSQTKFAQVFPVQKVAAPYQRSEGQRRAVVLVHGIRAHPFSNENVAKAKWCDWQQGDSRLVKAIAKEADVFAFAYSQDAALEDIAACAEFRDNIGRLKKLGYPEIVLVGHSAGGLIVRQFVEDHPAAGVTKVIQVCAPNAGTSWGKLTLAVRKRQEAFLGSLTRDHRQKCLQERIDKKIPDSIEFVAVVCKLNVPDKVGLSINILGKDVVLADVGVKRGDGVVSCLTQWPEDMQKQGIPAVLLADAHFTVMHSKAATHKIAELVREPQLRWDPAATATTRSKLFGDEP